MTITEIKDFLRSRPGYLRWGAGKLANLIEADIKKCKKALKEVRKEVSYPKEKETDENLVLRSRWFNGKEWCESYRNTDLDPEPVTKEDWIDIIKEIGSIDTITSIDVPTKIKRSLVVWSSDKHIGASIPSDALYKRRYDEHIFHQRMVKIYDKVISYFLTYGRLDKLVLADLGDSLDGFNGYTTRGGHRLPQNLSNKEAARVHFYTHKWFYESLIKAGVANEIIIYNVTNDNHSGDFGWHACFALEQYGTVAWPNVRFVNQEEFLGHLTLYNRAFIITHGKDKKNRFKGLPLNINSDTEGFIMDYVMDRGLTHHKIHVRKGDLHQNVFDCSRKKMTYFNVGSVFGSSDWIMDNFSDGEPSCAFEIIEEGDNNDLHPAVLWL
jgi:hypothetical protein